MFDTSGIDFASILTPGRTGNAEHIFKTNVSRADRPENEEYTFPN
jgi:hypothetical protein